MADDDKVSINHRSVQNPWQMFAHPERGCMAPNSCRLPDMHHQLRLSLSKHHPRLLHFYFGSCKPVWHLIASLFFSSDSLLRTLRKGKISPIRFIRPDIYIITPPQNTWKREPLMIRLICHWPVLKPILQHPERGVAVHSVDYYMHHHSEALRSVFVCYHL